MTSTSTTTMVQFHPSASSSFGLRLHFPASTYTSLLTPQRRRFCLSLHSRNPRARRSALSISSPTADSQSTSTNWIHKWDELNRHYRPRQPPTVFNYRIYASASGGSGSTMDRIVEKLKKFGYMDKETTVVANTNANTTVVQRVIEKGSVEDIFYVEDGMLPNARGGFRQKSILGNGVDDVFRSDGDITFPWGKMNRTASDQEREEYAERKNKERNSLAELTLPESELRRLRN